MNLTARSKIIHQLALRLDSLGVTHVHMNTTISEAVLLGELMVIVDDRTKAVVFVPTTVRPLEKLFK